MHNGSKGASFETFQNNKLLLCALMSILLQVNFYKGGEKEEHTLTWTLGFDGKSKAFTPILIQLLSGWSQYCWENIGTLVLIVTDQSFRELSKQMDQELGLLEAFIYRQEKTRTLFNRSSSAKPKRLKSSLETRRIMYGLRRNVLLCQPITGT